MRGRAGGLVLAHALAHAYKGGRACVRAGGLEGGRAREGQGGRARAAGVLAHMHARTSGLAGGQAGGRAGAGTHAQAYAL